MKNVLRQFKNTSEVIAFNQLKALANLSIAQEAYTIAGAFVVSPQNIIVIKQDLYEAQQLFQQLSPWLCDQVLMFASEDSLRVAAVASSPQLVAERLDTMIKAMDSTPKIIVTHVGAATRYLPTPRLFNTMTLDLQVNQRYALNMIKLQLVKMGYTHVPKVEQPLVFSFRGNIIDVFPPDAQHPIRIEFFDDEIESIRLFDANTQRTQQELHQLTVYPASDLLFSDDDLAVVGIKIEELLTSESKKLIVDDYQRLSDNINNDLDLLRQYAKDNHLYRYRTYLASNASIIEYVDNPLLVISAPSSIRQYLQLQMSEQVEYIQELYHSGHGLLTFEHQCDAWRLFDRYRQLPVEVFYEHRKYPDKHLSDVFVPDGSLATKLQHIAVEEQRKLLIINQHKLVEVVNALVDLQYPYVIVGVDGPFNQPWMVMLGDIYQGISDQVGGLTIYTNQELFKEQVKLSRFEKKFLQAQMLDDYQELHPRDYVVHYHHGIGQYLGIVTREVEGIHKDYLHVLYRNDAMLYVPLEQFKLIRKFVSSEGAKPKLSALGSNEWSKTKAKLEANVEIIAGRLMELYATRQSDIGFAFSLDYELQTMFENDFIYELTPDQATAIKEVKADMEQPRPMDRLLCGDVGFGKTEVALRAAFKAVLDQKQVAFLCPTTILSAQHYHTFFDRLAKYGVRLGLLNRFVSDSEAQRVIKQVHKGQIDVLIGTHRILSNDIKFHDLGLLVIDEEQRFGVIHKEKIKELKQSVDVLSLSATPIPRTLQMSLIGIRSLSLLNTPPANRVSVQTYVLEKNMIVIKEVIQRELARHGQVFYLYNNINTIYSAAQQIKNKIPLAKVAVAHGQMHKDEIEDVMVKFTNKEYDVLVCTTIIETGIDIPNANTIIIEQADRFGLSQLYQIKGRVGRSDVLAYAYLLYTPNKQLSEIATKRLKAVKDFTQLGSGYKIAMRDLTIRGAGDLLGPEQSGFINTVGIDMYLEILGNAIRRQKGLPVEDTQPTPISTIQQVDAYIPEPFTQYDLEKISLYDQIDQLKDEWELQHLIEKTRDLYGKLPKAVQLLFEKKRLDLMISEPRIESFKQKAKGVEITFTSEYSQTLNGEKIFGIVSDVNKDIRISYLKQRIIIFLPNNIDWLMKSIEVLQRIK